ncbi:MAG: hypothetical protein JNG85_15735, partial [Spirochaetaceae bacterium]|nr:hypothetical protein [Spirochaetaceae bacterium]
MRTTSLRVCLSSFLLAGGVCLVAAAPAAAQSAAPAAAPLAFAGLLSEANAKKARGLLSELDAARKGIAARMDAARAALAKAEQEALVARAVARARPEAATALAPDSSYRGTEAAEAAYAAARSASLAAARALVEGSAFAEGKSVADLEKAAAAKAAELGKLLRGAGLGDKGTAAVEKELLPRLASFAELFPEAFEVGALLKKSGVEGKGLWLAALSRLDARSAAAFLVESRAEALKRAPAAAATLDRLAAVLEAEALWRRAAPIALHAAAGDPEGRLAASVQSFAALGEERAAALLAAAERGPWRLGGLGKGTSLPTGGEGPARRLARLAAALSEPRRRSL